MTANGARRAARDRSVTGIALSLIAVGCLVGILVPAGLSWDFGNFYNAGRRVAAGQVADLYHADRPIEGTPAQGMRFWGAPLSAALFAPLAALRPEAALIVFKIQNVAALFLALWILYRHYARFTSQDRASASSSTALFAVMCLVYQPFWTIFRVGGQSTPTVLLLIVVGALCLMDARPWLAALLLASASMLKPTLAVMLVFLVAVSGMQFVVALVTTGLLLVGISTVMFGWPIHMEFLRAAIEGSQLARPWPFNSSLYVPIENIRLLVLTKETAPRAATALVGLTWVIRFGVVAMFATIVRGSHRQSWTREARRHFEVMMAVCFWLLVSQTIWEHYLALLFPFLAYLVAMRAWLPLGARRLLWAIFVLSLFQNLILTEFLRTHLDLRGTASLIAIGIVKSGPLLLTMVVLGCYRRSIFASYAAPAWLRIDESHPLIGQGTR